MSTIDPGVQASGTSQYSQPEGSGWIVFAGIMMMIAAILNVIYGIAAISNSKFFISGQKYIVSDLKTWGWITLIIGIVMGIAAFSIWAGNQFGRWVGIIAASASAISALMSIPSYPLWSLAVFAVDILIIYGLAAYGGQHRAV
jgi:hypothetical protein